MTRASGKPSQWRVDVGLVFVALIWGSTFVLVKQALDNISTLLFLTLRFSIAAAALLLLFWNKLRMEEAGRHNLKYSLKGGVIAGVCLFSGYVLQTFGLKYTTAAKAGFITGMYIPFVPIFGALIYRKFPRNAEIIGVSCAFAGMALLSVKDTALGIGFGDLLVLGCAVAYTLHILVLGSYAQTASIAVLTLTQIVTAALLGAATFWWAEPPKVQWSKDVWIALGVTSLFATALAFAIQTWAQQYSSPTRTALIFAMEPVFAWVTSYIVLGENLSRRGIYGAALILSGILLVELKPQRFERHHST